MGYIRRILNESKIQKKHLVATNSLIINIKKRLMNSKMQQYFCYLLLDETQTPYNLTNYRFASS